MTSEININSPQRRGPKTTTRASFIDEIRERTTGPGGVYNLGNIIALTGGIAVQVIGTSGDVGFSTIVMNYLFGNPGASCLTLAMIIFFISGEAYHRAWRDAENPILKLNRWGDFLQGIAGVVLTVALVAFGNTFLAISAGLLLVVGKFGSAAFPETDQHTEAGKQFAWACRVMVVVSRFPSLGALGVSLVAFALSGGDLAAVLMAGLMFICYLIWLSADYLLWSVTQAKSKG